MKPLHDYTPHQTFDLTECKVHCLTNDDGTRRIVALVPKTFSKGALRDMPTITGDVVNMRPYLVTEWEEIVLMTLPAAPPTD